MDFRNGVAVQSGIPDDAALADVIPFQFELRLDEANQVTPLFQDGKGGPEDESEGNERDVDDNDPGGVPGVRKAQIPAIELLPGNDAWILAQLPGQLIRADVERVNSECSSLEEAIRKAAGGGANVHGHLSGDINTKGVQGSFKLEPAAADMPGFFLHVDHRRVRDLLAGLGIGDAFDGHLAGEDEPLGLLPGVGEGSFDEQLVKALAQEAISDWLSALIILRIFP